MNLNIEGRVVQLNRDQQKLASAAQTREAFRTEFERAVSAQFAYTASAPIFLSESALKRMVAKYSEQLVFTPLNDIRYWFYYRGGRFLDPGYPPLYYGRSTARSPSASKTAVAAVGEGVSGFLAQRRYRARKLARPNHDYPDVVMETGTETLLVESKAHIAEQGADRWAASQTIKERIQEELLGRFAAYVSSCSGLDPRPVKGLLVGTSIWDVNAYDVFLTEVRLA